MPPTASAPSPSPYRRILGLPPAFLLGVVQALAILAENALRRRGVERPGGTEQVNAGARRTTPFVGYRHALAVALHVSDPGGTSPIPRNALAEHSLPRGVVLDQMACRPTKSRGPAREVDTGAGDVLAAIADARVGARSYWEEGRFRHAPGRALTAAELGLVRLVDVGELKDRATLSRKGRRTQVETLALERLHPGVALSRLREQGLPGLWRTEKEARIALTDARRAIKLVLEERGLVPGFADEEGVDVPPDDAGEAGQTEASGSSGTTDPAAPQSGDRRRGPRRTLPRGALPRRGLRSA
jgi:hypothetical protein